MIAAMTTALAILALLALLAALIQWTRTDRFSA
jgi:hypothetical protein